MIRPDRWIREMSQKHGMIEPFAEGQVRPGVISYGVSSYGYDIRVADEFKIFTNVNSTMVDPKSFDPNSMIDYKGDVCIVPPNSFALARTVEYFRIPRNVLTVCLGKCVTGDTRVVDASTGAYLPVSEFIARRGTRTAGLAGLQVETHDVEQGVMNGVQPVFTLTTRAGLTVRATRTHPFRTFEGWTALEHLAPGDRIAVARRCDVFGDGPMPAHEATLLGFMLSDGQCDTPGHSPRFSNTDPVLVRHFEEAARASDFHVSPVGHDGDNRVNRRGRGGAMEGNRASAWLASLGCNVGSARTHVPQAVFTARRDVVAAFLRALFAGEGSVYRQGDGFFLEYASISRRLAEDVRHLLLRFGVFALLRHKDLWTGGEAWRVQVTDKDMIALFAREIGFTPGSEKDMRLREILAAIAASPKRKSNVDTLPPAAWGTMRDAAHGRGVSLHSLGIPSTSPRQSLGHELAAHVAAPVDDRELDALVRSDVVWDAVVDIAFDGLEPVYDITVPGAHNFLANDIVVHNSTYARCGIILNVTPFEPEWEGYATLEISNTTPLPAKIYANEGIAQVLFFESDEPCEVSYGDKKGKYQSQVGIVLPKVL